MKMRNKLKMRNKNKTTKKIIASILVSLSLFFLSMSIVSAKGFYYNIELYYDGDIKVKNVKIEFSNEELSNIVNERYFETYYLDIIDINGNKKETIEFGVLNVEFYDIANESNPDELIDGGLITLENASFEIYAPYYENAKEIVIYNNEKEFAREDVSEFSKVRIESEEKISDKELDEKIEEKKEISKEAVFVDDSGFISESYWYLILILIFILIVIFYLLKKRIRKK